MACHAARSSAAGLQHEDGARRRLDDIDCLVKMAQRGTLFLDGISEMPVGGAGSSAAGAATARLARSRLDRRTEDWICGMIASSRENLQDVGVCRPISAGALPAIGHGGDRAAATAGAKRGYSGVGGVSGGRFVAAMAGTSRDRRRSDGADARRIAGPEMCGSWRACCGQPAPSRGDVLEAHHLPALAVTSAARPAGRRG